MVRAQGGRRPRCGSGCGRSTSTGARPPYSAQTRASVRTATALARDEEEAGDSRGDRDAVGAGRRSSLGGRGRGALAEPVAGLVGIRRGELAAGDGAIDPPRNVRAYSLAMQRAGVELRERTRCEELVVEGGRVVGVVAGGERIECSHVLITGGPSLRAFGASLGLSIPVGGARRGDGGEASEAGREQAMVFDVERVCTGARRRAVSCSG